MDNKRFKISGSKFVGFAAVLFLTLILGLFLCSKIFSDFEEKILTYVIACVVLGVIVGIVFFVLSKDEFLQILDDGFEVVQGNKVTKYSFSDFKGTNVVKNYTNGIPTGTTREIKVQRLGEKETKISCEGLSEKEFSQLASLLGKIQYDMTHDEVAPSEVFFEKANFAVPGKAILEANRNIFVMYIVLAVVLAILGTILILSTPTGEPLQVIGGFGVAGAIAILILEIFPWGKVYLDVRSIPSNVALDTFAITVDSEMFKVDTVTHIGMVPPSYEIMTRDLIITTRDGVNHKYNFGKGGEKDKYTYVNYPDLYAAVKMWCITQKVDFTSQLG